MSNFLLISIIGSILLTAALNLLPLLFPNMAAKTEQKITEHLQRNAERRDGQQDAQKLSVRIIFPWKAMILLSLGLTLAVNIIAMFARASG